MDVVNGIEYALPQQYISAYSSQLSLNDGIVKHSIDLPPNCTIVFICLDATADLFNTDQRGHQDEKDARIEIRQSVDEIIIAATFQRG
jgi:DNA topoisomerase IB